MVRFYLVPVEVGNIPVPNARVPKYSPFSATPLVAANTQWQARDYGMQQTMVLALDNTAAEDAALAAQPDVTKFSDNLDTPLGSRLAAMRDALELLNMPAHMLTGSSTDRVVLRGVLGIFMVAQCMQGKGRDIFTAGVQLSTTMASIGAAARNDLAACMQAVGFGAIADAATGSTTVRDLLASIATTASPTPMLGVAI